jgi:superfamily II RNA helicase
MADVIRIKEIDARNAHVAEPFRSILNDFAASQGRLAELNRARELLKQRQYESDEGRYRAFQQLRDFLTKLMNTEDVTMQFDHATSEEGWRVLREAERF